MRVPLLLLVIGAAGLAAGLAAAPAVRAQVEAPVSWSAAVEPDAAAPGERVAVVVRGEIEEGWRVYAMDSSVGKALGVEFEEVRALEPLGPPRQAEPKEGFDPTLEMAYPYFAPTARVEQAFRVRPGAAGAATLRGEIAYMVCNDSLCLPPMREPFVVTVRVEAPEGPAVAVAPPAAPDVAAPRPPAADAPILQAVPEPAAEQPTFRAAAAPRRPVEGGGGGLWAFLLLAAGAGVAALLAPCVFPMIPLTVSYFLHHAGDRRKAARMAGVYGLSIVGIFTGLGLAMALVVGAAGPQIIAANPWVNLFIGLILILFGLSLLGFYELRLPSGLLSYFNRQGNERGGYVGVLFMGLTLTLVSFSCTVPFVGGLLAAAVQNDWGRPLVGMVVFSSVFAFPFVLFALFPGALNRLPKSGAWMGGLKGVLGFVEVAAALKFLSNADLVWGLGVLPRPLAVALVIVLFTLTGLYLLGKLPLATPEAEADPQPVPATVGPLRLLTAVGFFGLALYFVPGLLGAPLGGFDAFLPPRMANEVVFASAGSAAAEAGGHEGWYQTRETAFAEAERTGRPVLIDFTGYTCTNCRYMEANVLSRPPIAGRIASEFVPLQLWTDDAEQGPELQRYQLQLTGRLALPTYAIVAPDGTLIEQVSGVVPAERFAQFLDAGATGAEDRLALR